MGLEYYLVNKENKTFYDLGKESWYVLMDEIDAVTDLEYLELFIKEDVFDDNLSDEYCKEMAYEIYSVAKCKDIRNIIVVNDSGDDSIIFRSLKYKCIGCRYRDDNNPEYNKELIEFNNRHFKPENNWRYNVDCSPNSSFYHIVEKYIKVF